MGGAARAVDTVPAEKVEIALFDLNVAPERLAGYFACLSADEQTRATQFRHQRDRDRFVARRGQLRQQLARAAGRTARDLLIAADACGKPFLPDHPGLHFSSSNSRELALCAMGLGIRVGCDIEWRNPELACRHVAARLFAAAELDALTALPDGLWTEGFFNCWTRKEAYVKALGLGLSYPLSAFTVSVVPGEPARLINALPGWALSSFEPAPGYQAALVVGMPH